MATGIKDWAARFVSWGKHKRATGIKKQIPRQALPEICQERLGWAVLSRNCKEQNITVLPFRAYTRLECKCKLFSSFHCSFPGTHPLKNHAMTTCRYLYYSPLHWYFHEPIYSLNAITRHVLYWFIYLWFNTLYCLKCYHSKIYGPNDLSKDKKDHNS